MGIFQIFTHGFPPRRIPYHSLGGRKKRIPKVGPAAGWPCPGSPGNAKDCRGSSSWRVSVPPSDKLTLRPLCLLPIGRRSGRSTSTDRAFRCQLGSADPRQHICQLTGRRRGSPASETIPRGLGGRRVDSVPEFDLCTVRRRRDGKGARPPVLPTQLPTGASPNGRANPECVCETGGIAEQPFEIRQTLSDVPHNTLIEGAGLNGNSAVDHGTTLPDVDPPSPPCRRTTDTSRSALVPEAADRSISKASTGSLQPNVNCPAILFIIKWIVKAARNFILCRKLTLRPYTPVRSGLFRESVEPHTRTRSLE